MTRPKEAGGSGLETGMDPPTTGGSSGVPPGNTGISWGSSLGTPLPGRPLWTRDCKEENRGQRAHLPRPGTVGTGTSQPPGPQPRLTPGGTRNLPRPSFPPCTHCSFAFLPPRHTTLSPPAVGREDDCEGVPGRRGFRSEQQGSPVSPEGCPAQDQRRPRRRSRPGPRCWAAPCCCCPGAPAGPEHGGTGASWGSRGGGLGSLAGPRSSLWGGGGGQSLQEVLLGGRGAVSQGPKSSHNTFPPCPGSYPNPACPLA